MKDERRLSDLWWVRGQRVMPQAYTCPLLMTLTMWWMRLRGKDVYWRAAARADDDGWISPARVVVGSREIHCLFPRKMILWECAFWNTSVGGRMR